MGRHKIIKPNVATVNPMNIGLATVIPLNDEGRTFLVDQVYQRRIMWDRTHPDFARHNERKRAMEEIREALLVNGWIQAKIPLHKVKNTISMLKACYRTKKKKGQFEKHAANCQWLRKIDTFMADSLAPYKANEKRLGPGGLCSLEDHMKILNFYKNHELLWNPKHPDYHDRPMHAEVWTQCEMYINKDGMTAEICKKISKTLRIRYVNRRKVMSLADVDQYSQHLEWFRVAESFLGPLLFPVSKPKVLPLSEVSICMFLDAFHQEFLLLSVQTTKYLLHRGQSARLRGDKSAPEKYAHHEQRRKIRHISAFHVLVPQNGGVVEPQTSQLRMSPISA
jgi:Alcohol dehydrogenase transcription factor Myb/SANT-like